MPELFTGAIGSFTGVNVLRSYYLERGQLVVGRGQLVVGVDPGCRIATSVFEGRGLLRGVAYSAPGVERGYLIEQAGSSCDLLDAPTGKIVRILSDEAIEIEQRYRSKPLADAVMDPR